MDYMDVSWASFGKYHFCNNYNHFNPEYIASKEENAQLIVFLSVLDAPTFRALVEPIRNISLIEEDIFSILKSPIPGLSNPVPLDGF